MTLLVALKLPCLEPAYWQSFAVSPILWAVPALKEVAVNLQCHGSGVLLLMATIWWPKSEKVMQKVMNGYSDYPWFPLLTCSSPWCLLTVIIKVVTLDPVRTSGIPRKTSCLAMELSIADRFSDWFCHLLICDCDHEMDEGCSMDLGSVLALLPRLLYLPWDHAS